jgi:hypothetical protein
MQQIVSTDVSAPIGAIARDLLDQRDAAATLRLAGVFQ